jgi:YD repeat-containing protein
MKEQEAKRRKDLLVEMDRVATRRDPLGNSESYQYDRNGNLTESTYRLYYLRCLNGHPPLDPPLNPWKCEVLTIPKMNGATSGRPMTHKMREGAIGV